MKRKCGLLFVFAMFCTLLFSACTDSKDGISGTYEGLRGSWDYVFENDGQNSGTFEIYEKGKLVGEEHTRYINTWKLEDDVLTLIRDEDNTFYFKVYDEAIIRISSEKSSPKYERYIAPEGDRFDYQIGHYAFYEDGSVKDTSNSNSNNVGEYYRENNVIYCNIYYSGSNYYPIFYIYDTDHIADASDVYLKK